MRVGLQIGLTNTQQKSPGDALIRVAEQAGFATLS